MPRTYPIEFRQRALFHSSRSTREVGERQKPWEAALTGVRPEVVADQ